MIPRHLFAALRHRDFRWLWTGTFCSSAGQWLQQATLGWVVYDLTGSGALLGAVIAMRAIPMLILAPVTGVVADRMDRRKALALAQMPMVIISFLMSIALAVNAVQVWHLFAFTLCAGFGVVFDRTLRSALVFGAVPREDAANAVALNSIAFSVTRAVGPAIAGILIALIGPAWNFGFQGLLYLSVTAAVLMTAASIGRPPPRKGEQKSAWKDMKEGVRFIANDRVARTMVLFGLLPPVLLIPSFSAMMPVFAKTVFQTGPDGLGLLLSSVGVGGVIGGLVAASVSRYEKVGQVQAIALVGFAVSLIGFANSPNMPVAMFFLVGAGIAEMVHASSNTTTLQMCAPHEMRGRISALLPVFPAFISLGSLTHGIGADLIGAPLIVTILAGIAICVTALVWMRSGTVRNLRLSKLPGASAS
jgi:MFS family permease